MARVRSVEFLPEIFQTPVNRQFLNATLDQLVQEPAFQKTQGFVGRKIGPGVNAADRYVIEPTAERNNYQLEPGVVSLDPDTNDIKDAITYPGINAALSLQGAKINNADRLYTSEYYTWDPFVDFDKFVNYSQYYWLPEGPDSVDVFSTGVPLTDTFVVDRANGVYTFSGLNGNNPVVTLLRGGNYNFQVAQNAKEDVNFRVANDRTSSYVIDYQPNPVLTLVRGNTYTFTLVLDGVFPFYIKTQPTLGTTNVYSNGVSNNGATIGTITFVVPQDAPDTLYYVNPTQPNMQGVMQVIDATPGTGPGFWIQTDPGVNGRIPSTPNISSRDVLGVLNNGEDLGTVTFNVPLSTAQNFYYTLAPIGNVAGKLPGTVDLVTTLNFNEINNIFLEPFFEANPDGIDGIKELNGKTVVFLNQTADAEAGGWQITTGFDPLPNVGNVQSPTGSYDTTTFDQTTNIDSNAIRYSVWQIQYNTTEGGQTYMTLNSVLPVSNLEKFQVQFGAVNASTSWFKNASGFFEQIPLLTAIKDTLFYQDGTDPEIFGQIRLLDQSNAETIFIEDIIGQKNYTSPNGVVFTNGLKVVFRGDVVPTSYANNEYYIEGVGTAIKLLPVVDFVTPEPYTQSLTLPYDSTPYDVGAYDQIINAPIVPDYLTINRASPDLNAWTRSNRWFHIDVINATAEYNNTVPAPDNQAKARRPILEFRAGTKLFDFGTQGKQPVNIVDFEVTDALSNINGTTGYSVDGYNFISGTRVIFAADTDPQVRNKIYEVQFIVPDSVPPLIAQPIINLVPASDSTVLVNQTTVCLSGNTLQGKSFYYDGIAWLPAQEKTAVNQAPLFDVYDSNGVSFADRLTYPSSTFRGSKLFSYGVTNSTVDDPVLGFPLRYLSLANVGDIVFDNNLYTDQFNYVDNAVGQTKFISEGFVRQYTNRVNFSREIGWQPAVTRSLQRQQFQFRYDGSPLLLDVKVDNNTQVPAIQLFVNNKFQEPSNYTYVTTDNTTTITLTTAFVPGDIIEVSVLSSQVSRVGFYQIPVNLENNPLNANSETFTLGTVRSHYETIGQNLLDLQGPIVGANNSRDLGNLVPYGLQILQQSSPLTLTGYFQRSQQYNIYSAIEYNSREYIKYKSLLLETVIKNEYSNMSVAEILDSAVAEITKGRTDINSFYWSDMMPTGAVFTELVNPITPITTPEFNTTQTYDFSSANYLGLLVYLTRPVANGSTETVLLVRDQDYEVSADSPRIFVTYPLLTGDVITIREYSNTAGNFVPNTPSKMGLYPKYVPQIYVDPNYVDPQVVIQGHDGSITMAFNDIRDDVLLEFEKRIYNNIKTDGNPIPLTAEDVIPGFFRTTDYSQIEINEILNESFLIWVGWNKLNYTAQTYDPSNPFTYNYSTAGNKINNAPLPGAWRGIYQYFYDTASPNLTPWEMLGLSEKPDWWEDRYGPGPYTADNLVLWDDLELGLVADPVVPYIKPQFARPGLTEVIPNGSEGQLLAPINSVVGPYDPTSFRKSWVPGDGGPVEYAWQTSSSYPFAIMRLLALTRPAEFFSLFADRDLYKFDEELNQYLYNGRYRLSTSDLPNQPIDSTLQIYGNGVSKASYINWIVDYNQQLGRNSTESLTKDLQNISVRLCYRMASFTDKQYLKVFVERSSPDSTNSGLLLPDESYNLFLYKNQPFARILYSSLIVERTASGYAVWGYNNATPYFNILVSSSNGLLQTVSAGGTEVRVPVQYTNNVAQVPYGYAFTNTTMVVDFILSYGKYLESQGLVFQDRENGYILNWNQMATEFLYFSQQDWAPGTVINLNPVATTLRAVREGAVVDTIISTSPENLLLDQNRQTLPTRDLIINREGNTFTVSSASNQTISFLNLQFTNYEDIVILDNISIFSDLIYDPVTGARQNRIRITASTTTDWNGTLDAQGFILNQDNVREWQPNRKYTKGEIVLYKNNYWSAQTIVQPKAQFDYNDWVKSDYSAIQEGLLPNLANKADQLANSYNTQVANLERDNDLLSYGLIGFRPRQYMVDLNLDDVSQVNLYKQFLPTKGTTQAAEIFTNADLGKEAGEYNIYENWGVLVSTYGANAMRSFVELRLNEADLNSDPSTVQVVEPQQTSQADQTILLDDVWRESYKLTSTDIFPTTYSQNLDTVLPSAGYVNINDVDITVFSLDDPSSIEANIDQVGIGTKIWAAKSNSYDWNVYRCNRVAGQLTQITDNLNGTSVAQFNQAHNLAVGDLIIVRYFDDTVNGVYRVLSIPSITSVTVAFSFVNTNQTTITGTGLVFYLQSMRVAQASDVVNLPYANELIPGALAFVDNNGQGLWQVLQKQDPFDSVVQISVDPPVFDSGFGTSVAQTLNLSSALIGSPKINSDRGGVYIYSADTTTNGYSYNGLLTLPVSGSANAVAYGETVAFGQNTWGAAGASQSLDNFGYVTPIYKNPVTGGFTQTQLLTRPGPSIDPIRFGQSIAISADEKWMYIGAPTDANGGKVYAFGLVDVEDQSVRYTADGSTISFNYNSNIVIDQSERDTQLVVTVGTATATVNVDYSVGLEAVTFSAPPATGEIVTIRRRSGVQLIGDGSTVDFSLNPYLYTVNNIDSFTIRINGNLQRPYIDYEFDQDSTALTKDVKFTTAPAANDLIDFISSSYWQYCDTISVPGLNSDAEFGISLTTSTNGQQVLIGAELDQVPVVDDQGNTVQIKAGSVYVFDRSIVNYLIDDADTTTYAIPGSINEPIMVKLNNEFLNIRNFTSGGITTTKFINGDVDVDIDTAQVTVLTALTVGDVLAIETNLFTQVQKVVSNNPTNASAFGASVDICATNCSLYTGSPLDSTVLPQAGSVERNINQSRTYGVTTSTVANPSFVSGESLRINNYDVSVPVWTSSVTWALGTFVVDGSAIYKAVQAVPVGVSIGNTSYWAPSTWNLAWVNTINDFGIPNVIASATPDVSFVGDGSTKTFNVGSIYSDTVYTGAPNTLVYVDDVLQVSGFSWSSNYEQLNFVTAPTVGQVITVVSGRITISVKNSLAAPTNNKLTVLPGITGSAFGKFGFVTFVYTQTIVSPSPSDYAYFGSTVQVDTGAVNLVVGAPNGNIYDPVTFDGGSTRFDDRSTTFFDPVVNSGVVFTYDFLPSANGSVDNPGKFVFGQQIFVDSIESLDQFGQSVNFTNGRLMIGAPGNDGGDSSVNYGTVLVFENTNLEPAWKVLHQQQAVVDVDLINTVFMYDKLTSTTQTYFDFIDPLQGKILGAARRNIDYIGAVDPANYNTGSVRNQGNSWGSEHVGEIWWDTNNVRFIDPNQDDIVYASRRWGQVFPGSSVEVYQWIESSVPPVSYTGPGIPLSTISYTVRTSLNRENIFVTNYYFWVRGISTIDTASGKTLSTTGVARYIESPRSSGIPYIALLNSSTVAIYNGLEYISAADTILHIGYDREANDANIHQEYQFVADGEADSFLNATLYRKLQDSFCGVDTAGAVVPDPFLSPAERYGVQFRPRQSMFVNRFLALQNYLEYANRVLKQYPIVETRNFSLLNSQEPEPSVFSGEWDQRLANLEELSFQNLNAVPLGYRYLVASISTQNGFWGIYEVVDSDVLVGERTTQLVRIQNYSTPQYWYHIDWYLPGYNSTIQPVAEVPNYSALSTLTLLAAPIGSSVRVTANAQGKFEIYLRTDLGWERVGLEDGTIQFREELWNYALGNFGFDVEVFDSQYFDQEPTEETRKIIQAINEQLFVGDLLIERNRSLILMFNFVYSEFSAPEWLIKTSLIDVDHKIRALVPFQTYLQDNQTFVLDYIQEVKPYHVQVREFNLSYYGEDSYPGMLTDFDIPAYWKADLEIPQYVSPVLQFDQDGKPYTFSSSLIENIISDAAPDDQIWTLSPWNEWFNNYLLQIQSVQVVNGGSGYTVPPTVAVDGVENLTWTTTINSAGQVTSVNFASSEEFYFTAPTITLIGGNGTGAQAVAVMGNQLVRSIKTTIKYDRCEYSSTIVDWESNVNYDNGTLVRYLNRVWEANSDDSTGVQTPTFDPAQWTLVNPNTLSGADRTMGYYTPTVNEPGLSLPLLIDGIDYPGVQVTGVGFNQNTGFDVGNYDINPFDNIAYDASGRPTYDPAILDAVYESSYLDIYLGTRATDVNVDGGAYVDTYSSHAPEELVPGAEFDTLDLRVYTRPGSDWENDGHGFPEKVINFVYEDSASTFSFADILPYPVQVIVSNQTTGLELDQTYACAVDWVNQTITINAGASPGDVISVAVYELGGGNQLYKQIYNGADVGDTIVVPVSFDEIQEFAIFVNGILVNNYTYESLGFATQITFSETWTSADFISLVAIGPTLINSVPQDYGWSAPQTQIFVADGSSLAYDLDNSLEYTNPVTLIVTVNGIRARTAAGAEYIGDGSTAYLLPQRLGVDASTIADNEVKVFVDNIPQTLNVDYFVEPYELGDNREVIFFTAPSIGSNVQVYVETAVQCYVSNGQLNFVPGSGLEPILGDVIAVTTWNDTRQQNILPLVYVGPVTTGITITEPYDETLYDNPSGGPSANPGQFDFSVGATITVNNLQLGRVITDPSRLWVSLNGIRQFPGVDFVINGEELILHSGILSATDVVMISMFAESVVPEAMAFRIFQDMRGVQAVYRITDATTTEVTQAVASTDNTIHVADASALSEPDLSINIWGVVMIDGERIMYRERNTSNNTISSLLRGTAGTAAADHNVGSAVTDLGRGNLLPEEYQNYIVSNTSTGDGTTLVFEAEDINLLLEDSTIRDESVEVYVGGTLVTAGYTVTSDNPCQITFTTPPAAGVEVTILVRRGVTWYAPGAGTPSNGQALQVTNTQAARFLRGEI